MIGLCIYSSILMFKKHSSNRLSGLHLSENNIILALQLVIIVAVNVTQAEGFAHSVIVSVTFFADMCQVIIFHFHLVLVSDFSDLSFPHDCVCIFSFIFSLSYGVIDYFVDFYDALPNRYLVSPMMAGILALAFASCVHYRLRVAYYNFRKVVRPLHSVFFYSYAPIEDLKEKNLKMHSIWKLTLVEAKKSFRRFHSRSSLSERDAGPLLSTQNAEKPDSARQIHISVH